MSIYKSINNVMAELAKIGIGKGNYNQQQKYKFRGIDDIYNSLATLLSSNGICIFPCVTSRSVREAQTRNGGTLNYTTLEVEYTLVSSEDGSLHKCTVYGEAMDAADKSTNKAMSAAYKYMCLQVFCIPTEGDNDADATTHEVKKIEPQAKSEGAIEPQIFQAITKAISSKDKESAKFLASKLTEDQKQSLWKNLSAEQKEIFK